MDIDNGPHFYPYKYLKIVKLCLLKTPTIYVGINFIFKNFFFLLVSDESEKEMSQLGICGSGEFCL